jgi:hypothetical protein
VAPNDNDDRGTTSHDYAERTWREATVKAFILRRHLNWILCIVFLLVFLCHSSLRADPAIPPEIQALADSLGNDALKAFEYVRNNIKYIPYAGPLKGAVQTLFDQTGNDYDQGLLLIDLLRAMGYTEDQVGLVYGRTWASVMPAFPERGPNAWLGLSGSQINANGVAYILNHCVAGDTAQEESGTLRINRVWVKVFHAGEWYQLDPVNKLYSNTAKMAVGSMSGYDPTNFWNSAGGTIGDNGNSISSINENSISLALAGYTNLLSSSVSGLSVQDVIGKHETVQEHESSL